MTTIQPMLLEDLPAMAAMRQATLGLKGMILGPKERPMYDAMRAATPAAEGLRVEPAVIGGIAGFWCRPDNARRDARVLFLHGGGYVLGSALAYTNFAGQIAIRAAADTFVADYRLAPESPFPAAIDDSVSAYRGLIADGAKQIVLVGDSAGGGLALALLSILEAEKTKGILQPRGAAVMSPFSDLMLSGTSYETRAEADPIFTRDAVKCYAEIYLNGHDASDPKASPLYARHGGLPPIRIDVGDDEVLLDDSVRYADRARAAGADVTLSIWTGMPHVFQSGLGRLAAAERSLDAIGEFVRQRLGKPSEHRDFGMKRS